MITTQVVSLVTGFFASPSYIERWGRPDSIDDASQHRFVNAGPPHEDLPYVRFLDDQVEAERVFYRSTSLVDLYYAVMGGLGIGPVTCAQLDGDAHRGLVQVWPQSDWRTPVWMSIHRDHRRDPGLKRVWDCLLGVLRDGPRDSSESTV